MRPAAQPTVVATGELLPAVGLSADSQYLIFGRPGDGAEAGAQYYVLDMSSMEVVPFSPGSRAGSVVAVTGDAPPARPFLRGDANGDGGVDISDAVVTLLFLFGDIGSIPCLDAGDANDDGSIDISDAVRILGSLFSTNKGLPPPFPLPGLDPTPDSLACFAAQ